MVVVERSLNSSHRRRVLCLSYNLVLSCFRCYVILFCRGTAWVLLILPNKFYQAEKSKEIFAEMHTLFRILSSIHYRLLFHILQCSHKSPVNQSTVLLLLVKHCAMWYIYAGGAPLKCSCYRLYHASRSSSCHVLGNISRDDFPLPSLRFFTFWVPW